MQSILLVSMFFVRDQISLHGDEAHPIDGGLKYDLGDGLEILIRKMPDDPNGLDWSQLQVVVIGLWEYLVSAMRYRAVTFDILDIQDDVQIGWGHITLESGSLWNRTAKRDLQLSSPALPSANSGSGQSNSSLSTMLDAPLDWPVEDSDMTLRFTAIRKDREGRQLLDPEAVKNLLVVVIEIIQNNIATQGKEGIVGGSAFRYGRLVILEVINWPHRLTWDQLANVVLGLVGFMVDNNHYRTWYFSVFVHEPKVELAIGKIMHGYLQPNNVSIL